MPTSDVLIFPAYLRHVGIVVDRCFILILPDIVSKSNANFHYFHWIFYLPPYWLYIHKLNSNPESLSHWFSNNEWNLININNKGTMTKSLASFWWLYIKLWSGLTLCSSVFIVNFQEVNVGWETFSFALNNLKPLWGLHTICIPNFYQ